MGDLKPRKTPCPSCPYRQDVPSGIWSEDEYDKLPEYDRATYDQPVGLFHCHQRTGELCAGWVGCHDMPNALAVRLHYNLLDLAAVERYESPVPLFRSGHEAAQHGKRDIESPGEDARAKAAQITRLIEKRQREED